MPVGLVEGRGVRERGVGNHGTELPGATIELHVGVGSIEVDCYLAVSFLLVQCAD